MQVETNQAVSVQQQFSIGISKASLDTSAQLVNDLMTKTLGNSQANNEALASQGIGTKLNVVA